MYEDLVRVSVKSVFPFATFELEKCIAYPESNFGPSIADPTYYRPDSERVKDIVDGSRGVYDGVNYAYPQGEDDGRAPIPRAGSRDMAEISQDIRRRQDEIRTKIKKGKEAEAEAARINAILNPSSAKGNSNE